MLRANALYEGSICWAHRLPALIATSGRDCRGGRGGCHAHGATGKGNDQVRFELGAYALNPDIRVIAPWREWDLNSREKLLEYADRHNISIEQKQGQRSPYSMDANLLHISYEGGELEDPWVEPQESMWQLTCAPGQAPDVPQYVEIGFVQGDPVSLDGTKYTPAQLLGELNVIAGAHGVGRLDIVENRYVGMKSRGCYETPGGTILHKSHRAMESITLDREVAHLKDELMPRYAALVYNGYWWSPERRALQKLIDATQVGRHWNVRVKLVQGQCACSSGEIGNPQFV